MSSLIAAIDTVVPEGKSMLVILSDEGDTKLEWDPHDEVSTSIARSAFEKAKKARHVAYRITREGTKGAVADEFDPNAQKYILAPQMVGG